MTEYIYGDVLFIINFSMDFLALFIAGKIMHYKMKALRVIFGASVGALYGVLSLLLSLGSILDVILNLFVAFIMCFIAHFHGNIKNYICVTALFYGISLLMGGTMTAIFTKIGKYQTYIEIGGSLHTVYGDIPIWLFVVLAAVSALISWSIGKLIKRKKLQDICRIRLSFGDKEEEIQCLVDSGNMLCEPISGTPVMFIKHDAAKIIPAKIIKAMVEGIEKLDIDTIKKIRIIPSKTVAGDGMVIAAKPDRCYIKTGNKSYEPKKVLVAVDFTSGDFGGYPGLLPECLA